MTPHEFIAKWKKAQLSERSAAQQHFLDLCELLEQDKPAAADPEGSWYTFERGVHKTGGGEGWADVWMRGHFAWEYKRKRRSLDEAYKQLLLYRENLDNPPLLVVCDLDRFQVHTNFTGTAKQIYQFNLDGLAEPANLALLRKVFTDPDGLKPGQTTEAITQDVADRFCDLADGMRIRRVPAEKAAHFLMKLMFCMFAESIDLLPNQLFRKLLNGAKNDPARLSRLLAGLFEAMRTGGDFGAEPVLYFNGGLFADAEVVPLTTAEIAKLVRASECNWSNVEPSIFGTLFERMLDPAKRSQIGAHYTSKADILTLLEPVLMAPLRREWEAVKTRCEELWPKIQQAARKSAGRRRGKDSKVRQTHDKVLLDFVQRLAHVTVLDPACGSGNFLYVAINLLLDLEKEVIAYATNRDTDVTPHVGPTQLAGIEINPYAQQLAQVVIWIGHLQWKHQNGFAPSRNPVLEPIENIRLMDAILDLSDPENPREPQWPDAEFIVGNPPFLGDKMMRRGLGDGYVDQLRQLYAGRLPGQSDLCCYWFEKARSAIVEKGCKRAGLLATQGVRGGENRTVLDRINGTCEIIWAVSDRDWILEGAAVHVSMVAFDDGHSGQPKVLDGHEVQRINPNLTTGADVTAASVLADNQGLSFLGSCKGGDFDIKEEEARTLLLTGGNPNRRPNSDVVRPLQNSLDILRSRIPRWIIDNADKTLDEACLYDSPHRLVTERVKPSRDNNRDNWLRKNWWRPQRMRPEMRKAVEPLERFIVTTTTSKHRIFVWLRAPTLPDHQLIVFAREDDYFFGVLHSRLHELWTRAKGTQLRERESGFRYTPTTCFETFPLPPVAENQKSAIGKAAQELDALRSNWLNPPEWTRQEVLEFPGAADGPWARYVHDADKRRIGTVRYPRVVAKDAECAKLLTARTLTNLYNQRPTWLDLAHRKLDEAVFAAYGWEPGMGDEEILAKLLELNLQAASVKAVNGSS